MTIKWRLYTSQIWAISTQMSVKNDTSLNISQIWRVIQISPEIYVTNKCEHFQLKPGVLNFIFIKNINSNTKSS